MDPPRDGGSETIRSGWFTPLTGCHNVTPHPEAVVGLLLTSQLPPLIIVGSGTAVVRNVSIGYEAGSRTWWISLLFANVDSVAEKNGFWFSSEPLINHRRRRLVGQVRGMDWWGEADGHEADEHWPVRRPPASNSWPGWAHPAGRFLYLFFSWIQCGLLIITMTIIIITIIT